MTNPKWVEKREGSQENLRYEMIEMPIFPYNIWDHIHSRQFEVSVIILNHQRKEWLDNCLWSLLHQKTEWQFEIIIVDDASTDGVGKYLLEKYESLVRSKRMKYIKLCTRLGWMKPLRLGIDAADADTVLITQSDIVQPYPDGMQKMFKALNNKILGVFTTCRFLFPVDGDNPNDKGPIKRLEEMNWRENPMKLLDVPTNTVYAKDETEPWPYYAMFRWETAHAMFGMREPYYDRAIQRYIKSRKGDEVRKIHFMSQDEILSFHISHPFAKVGDSATYWWNTSKYSP